MPSGEVMRRSVDPPTATKRPLPYATLCQSSSLPAAVRAVQAMPFVYRGPAETIVPMLSIVRSVVVVADEEEPIAKMVVLVEPLFAWSEKFTHGEVVPIPMLPEKVVVERREVEEAKMPAAAKRGVEVAEVLTPKFEVGVKGQAKTFAAVR